MSSTDYVSLKRGVSFLSGTLLLSVGFSLGIINTDSWDKYGLPLTIWLVGLTVLTVAAIAYKHWVANKVSVCEWCDEVIDDDDYSETSENW